MSNETVRLTAFEEKELVSRARSRTLPAGEVRRARLLLMLNEGKSYKTIQQELLCDATFIVRWKQRFLKDRLSGLYARHPGRAVEKRTPKMEARILEWTRRSPPDGSTHWSTRKLAEHLGVHHMMVARVWKRARLQPHRIERYMMSNDPDFEQKADDVIGLYVKPPQHAVVFCVDEKTSIQALDRLVPVLPLAPGRAERHGFEYYRHGTLSLYAALNTRTGAVIGSTAPRHTSQEFVAFLADLVASQPRHREIHIIADNFSAHKTKLVGQFLESHPKVKLHYTPTYSSWLNQVELWFAKIERDVIARGVFTSVTDLKRKLMKYIRRYNETSRPIKWKYTDISNRIGTSNSTVTGRLLAMSDDDMRSKICSVCGASFGCGSESADQNCWCNDYPPIMPLDFSQDCRCPACLKIVVQERIAEYVQTVTPENASNNMAKDFNISSKTVEGIDYYINDDGNFVFTAWYHLKRGHCCRNGCKHCPYGYVKPQ